MLAPTIPCASTDAAGSGLNGSGVDWVARFTRSARDERQMSASTLEAYGLDLAVLSRWAAAKGKNLRGLTTSDLTRYVVERAAEGIQLSTLARHMSSFRRFYSFLIRHGVVAFNPAAAVLVPQRLRAESGLVRADVVRGLLRAPRGEFPSPASAYRARRDHAILCLLYGTGLGISEVRLLRWQQINDHWHVVRVPSRNGTLRSFVLDETLMGVLKALHQAAATNGFSAALGAYCFPTASGMPMTRQALCHVVRKWASECGQEQGVTPSALRQTGRANLFGRRPSRSAPAEA